MATYTRRDVLERTAAGGALIGAGLGTTAGTATAAGASFGDGVNLQPAYFCDGEQALGWDLMDQYPDIETVRIEIEPPSMGESQAELSDAKRWLDEAYERGYHVIATYHHHPHNGSDDPAHLQNAADWWVQHYDTLSRDAEFTINLMNEWGNHEVTADEYAAAYNDAIATVRDGTDYDGPIVCDVPGWGQGTHRAAEAAPQLQDDDLILSVHVYPKGWNATTGQALQPEHLDLVDETEYPCTIGEFGSQPREDGDADWSAIVDHANDLGWPVIGWAWNGGGGGMDMVDPYWGDGCPDEYTTSSYFDVVYEKLGDDDAARPAAPAEVDLVSVGSYDGEEIEVELAWTAVEDATDYVVYDDETVLAETEATEATVAVAVDGGQIGQADLVDLGVAARNDAGESEVRHVVVDCGGVTDTLVVDGEVVASVDGDDLYRDVNCDGVAGNRDVGEFFEQFHLDGWDRAEFDYSGNGRVSHGDVVALFEHVTG